MKTLIEDGAALMTELQTHGLKVGDSIQALCEALFNQGHAFEEKTVVVKIATDLMAGSYIGNPTMFAHTLRDKTPYPQVQSYLADGYFVIRTGHKKKPLTFRAAAREALENKGTYTVPRTGVPRSYRRRPAILSGALSKELGQIVCNESKGKTHLRWYLKD